MKRKSNTLTTSPAGASGVGVVRSDGESDSLVRARENDGGSVELFLPPALGAAGASLGVSDNQGTSPNGGMSAVSPPNCVDGGASLSSHVISGASVASHKRVGRSLLHHKPMPIDVMFAPSLNPQFTDIPLLQPAAPALSEKPSQVKM